MSEYTKKKKLVWVTPDDFMDTDFNPDLFRLLLNMYTIEWIIILPESGSRFKESDFKELKTVDGLDIQFIYSRYRQRDPRRLFFYISLYRRINRIKHDLLYFSYGPGDPYVIPLFWALNKNKTIFSVHEGNVNENYKLPFISKIILGATYPFVKYVHMFSPSSANIFHKKYPNAKIFTIPFGLKSFGESKLSKNPDNIIFLSFGIINYAKNIDLLIEAACNIYEQGHRGFKISINGSCANWDFYRSKMRYPEIFICDIRKIENAEIPDLFGSSHYLVQPYRATSQSGVLKIAFNYNIPIIASDLPGFRDEIEEGVNGFFFRKTDIKDLERVLISVLNGHDSGYAELLKKMHNHTLLHNSADTLNARYMSMFNDVSANGNQAI